MIRLQIFHIILIRCITPFEAFKGASVVLKSGVLVYIIEAFKSHYPPYDTCIEASEKQLLREIPQVYLGSRVYIVMIVKPKEACVIRHAAWLSLCATA
jgi:hypothetical protein